MVQFEVQAAIVHRLPLVVYVLPEHPWQQRAESQRQLTWKTQYVALPFATRL